MGDLGDESGGKGCSEIVIASCDDEEGTSDFWVAPDGDSSLTTLFISVWIAGQSRREP